MITAGYRIIEFGLGKVLVTPTKFEALKRNTIDTFTYQGIVLEETDTPHKVGSIVKTEEIELNDSQPVILIFHSIEGANELKETLDKVIAAMQAEQLEK